LAGSYSDGDKKELLDRNMYWYIPGVLVVAVFLVVGTAYCYLRNSRKQKTLRLEKALAGEPRKLVFANPSYETGTFGNQTGADGQASNHEGRGGQKGGSDHEIFVVVAEEEC
jgi:hypothetical protein